jgi:hypothetical protein
MENKSKTFLILGVVLVIGGLFYFFYFKNLNSTPYQVLTPDSYDLGTTVSLYKNTPPNFPAEVILENKALSYSGTVTAPDGKTQTKVSYQSEKNISDILTMYKDSLPKSGWSVSVNSVSPNVAIFLASKGSESVLITIVTTKQIGTAKDMGALVTFQYEK